MAANQARSWENSYTSYRPQVEKRVVVRKAGWITKGEKILYSVVAVCILVALWYIVSFSSSLDTLNRNIQSVEQKITNQQVVNEGLGFEIKELSRPERIIQYAKEHGLTIQAAEVKQANSYNH